MQELIDIHTWLILTVLIVLGTHKDFFFKGFYLDRHALNCLAIISLPFSYHQKYTIYFDEFWRRFEVNSIKRKK